MIKFVSQIKINESLPGEHETFGWLRPSLYEIRLQDFAFDHLTMWTLHLFVKVEQ